MRLADWLTGLAKAVFVNASMAWLCMILISQSDGCPDGKQRRAVNERVPHQVDLFLVMI